MRTAEEWTEEFYARGLMTAKDEDNHALFREVQADALKHAAEICMWPVEGTKAAECGARDHSCHEVDAANILAEAERLKGGGDANG